MPLPQDILAARDAFAPRDTFARRVAHRVELALGAHKFALWFGGVQGFAFEPESATLRVDAPHPMAAEWITRHYQRELTAAITAELGPDSAAGLRLQVAVAVAKAAPAALARGAAANKGGAKDNAQGAAARNDLIDTGRKNIPGNGYKNSFQGLSQTLAPAARPAPAPAGSHLGLRHRLDTFVVGPANALAYAAAERVCEYQEPANLHSGDQMLFIHGGCGLGKTHLLQGICRSFADSHPGAKVVYATGEQFTNAYIEATRRNTWDAFRLMYRGADLLAIDDVHFIGANKKQTQQEFLLTLKAALSSAAHTRVILAADSPPRQIHAFSEQLVSLCVQGLVVEVRPPDLATRRAMFEQLGRRRGLTFLPAALDALAGAATGTSAMHASVREIEGALTRLHALAMLGRPGAQAHEPVGLGLVRQLEQMESPPRPARPPKFDLILQTCCAKLGAAPEQVKGRSKHRLVTLARAAAVSLARELTAMSYPEIASALDRDSHSTALTAHQRLQKQLADQVLVPGLAADLTVAGLLAELRQEIQVRA